MSATRKQHQPRLLYKTGLPTVTKTELGHLSLIDLLVNGASGQESVNKDWTLLSITTKEVESRVEINL
jgi:hypothetical protein